MSFWIDSHQPLEFFDLQWRAAPVFSPRGFIPDPVAPIFLEKLGLPVKKILSLDQQQQRQMISSCWLDQQCLEFFRNYPEGLVIEIGAGYSSRFHRLSSALEWPRFKWCVLDQKSIIHSLRNLLPTIDHFTLAIDHESDDWMKNLPPAPAIALLIEQKTLQLDQSALESFCRKLMSVAGLYSYFNPQECSPVAAASENIFSRLLTIFLLKCFSKPQPQFMVLEK